MPEFLISSNINDEFKIKLAVDYNDNGEIEFLEFYDDFSCRDNPADLRFNFPCICEDVQEDWNVFFNNFMYLFESKKLENKLSSLKYINDSYSFSDEEITIKLIEED